ncbi:MAG: MBL fold metallo-hydrolase [Polyangiaceae bacterium]
MITPRLHPIALASIVAVAASACAQDGETAAPPEVQKFEACADFEVKLTEANPAYVWTPNAVKLVSEEVSPGVFAVYDSNAPKYGPEGIPLATSGGFVIGDKGVAMIETMLNRQLFCQVVGLVREQTDKPVLYAVNTSYHGDHSYGNAFLPPDVQIVQHERTAAHIAQHFEEDVAFMKANFGDDQGLDEITSATPDISVSDEGWSADLGGVTIEARYYGFGQTVGDLFVYVPEAQVMWTGNPLIAEAPAIPWLLDGHGDDVATTLAAARDSLPATAVVVPGHGRPITPGTFDFSVDYLDALHAGVQTAVDDGMDEAATVEAVSLEEFQGYVLWDWIHKSVNVPQTYAELSAK